MNPNVNIINWFEISVSDMARARKFYETIFSIEFHQMEMMGMQMAMFPSTNGNGKVSGALVQGPSHVPSMDGAKLYLNGNPDLSIALDKVEGAGGKIIMPKTEIGGNNGYMAIIIDTEGNNIGLHSGS